MYLKALRSDYIPSNLRQRSCARYDIRFKIASDVLYNSKADRNFQEGFVHVVGQCVLGYGVHAADIVCYIRGILLYLIKQKQLTAHCRLCCLVLFVIVLYVRSWWSCTHLGLHVHVCIHGGVVVPWVNSYTLLLYFF